MSSIGLLHFVICSALLVGVTVIAAVIVTIILVVVLNDNKSDLLPTISSSIPVITTTSSIPAASDPFNDEYNDAIYAAPMRQNVELQANISRLMLDEFNQRNIHDNLRSISSSMHVAGTPAQTRQMQRIADQYRLYGYEVRTYDYHVLLSYPDYEQPNTIELLDDNGGGSIISNGRGDPLGPDDASEPNARVWWNAYSTSGSVSQTIVYANYGRVSDFDLLAANNVSVTDRIALMRYGGVNRGNMVAEAVRRGAVGAILFSDPADYALDASAIFPNGIWLPASGAQRGTLKGPVGDPQTPLYPSKDYTYRISEADLMSSGAIPRIPVTPIGYRDAINIFASMKGPLAIADWQGAMNVSYRISSESVRYRLNVSCHTEHRNITNVIAYMRGRDEPDRTVLLSNHVDAWVYGSIDPNIGTSTLLEVARVLAAVSNRTGWRPRRTIAFGAWDAEEYGTVGSTEWAEEMMKSLQMNLVALINVDDIYGNMTLLVDGVPLLYRAMVDATKRVASPNAFEQTSGRKTLYDSWRHYDPDGPIADDPSIPLFDTPGSGSDFNRFIHYIGAPIIDFGFKCAPIDCDGLYHSMYDTPWTIEHILDPSFQTYTAVGQLWLELGRNLADSLVIPFNVSDYAIVFSSYVDDMDHYLRSIGFDQQIGSLYQSMMSNMTDSVARFQKAANTIQSHVDRANSGSSTITFRQMQMLNDRLIDLERAFIADRGIYSKQSINRHVVYAPSIDNQYAGVTFSGIRDPAANWHRCPIDDIECVNDWLETALLGFTKLQYAIESAILLLDLQGF